MKVEIKKLPKSKIEMTIEVPAKDFNAFFEKAILNLGKDLKMEGFREGHIPKEIIEKEISQPRILAEAAELCAKENYIKAITENKIEVISQPEVRILKMPVPRNKNNPFQFKATASVLPEVELPDYKKIALSSKKNKVFIEEKEIENTVKWLQKSRAKFTVKFEPAKIKDFVEIEYSSPQIQAGKIIKDSFILGEGHFLPNFEKNLFGMKTGQEKEFFLEVPLGKITLPGSVGNIGKANFKVKMVSVQNVELPEINDQFAQGLGEFEDLANLKKSIKLGIEKEKRIQESQRVRQEILGKITQASQIETPEILVEREKEQMLENLKKGVSKNLKISFTDYLNQIKKTEKDLKESFLIEAKKRVKNFLVLRELTKKEKIEVQEQELKDTINEILKNYPDRKTAEKEIDFDQLKSYYKEVIKNEKVLAKLESFAQ